MSRTDELRKHGGRERAGSGTGGSHPFVKWGEEYAWLEGRLIDTWEGQFGLTGVMEISAVGAAPLSATGKDEDGKEFTVQVVAGETVNVGFNHSSLQGKITDEDEGKNWHIAFEGWQKSKSTGNRFRVFAVIELTERETVPADDDDSGLPF